MSDPNEPNSGPGAESGGAPASPPSAEESGGFTQPYPGAAPVPNPGAPQSGSVPPPGAVPPPGSYGPPQPPYYPPGAPVPPGAQGPTGPYGGDYPGSAPAGYPVATATAPADQRPKTLAIIALGLGVVGLILAAIPFVTWFSGVFLLAGFVIALIALISKKQGGKGFGIAALAVSVVGAIVSLVLIVVTTLAVVGQGFREAIDEGSIPGTTTAPSDPGEEDSPATDAQEVTIVESAFGRESYDETSWWYVVILDNPNSDYVYEFAEFDIEAIDASGTILETSNEFLTLLPGEAALSGTFSSVGGGEIASLNIRGPGADEASAAPADETGTFSIEGLAATTDEFSTTVRGTLGGTFAEEQENVAIVIVARSPDGTIIDGEWTYVDRLPNDGTKVQFEAFLLEPLPADTTYEAYATL